MPSGGNNEKKKSPIGNQQGSVMAIALMVMATLLIVGLMSISDTIVESNIARNHTLSRQSFFLAEAAVRQAIQVMEDYADDPAVSGEMCARPSPLPWMQHFLDFDFASEVDFGDFRGDRGAIDYGTFVPSALADGNENASGFLVRFDRRIDSLDITDPTSVYEFSVFGRGVGPMRNDSAESLVKIKYKMRF